MYYGTKQNDGGTPYYLPRYILSCNSNTYENGFKKAQWQKVRAVIL
jgi:hypothetical protein